ncbi:hypothetical protein AB4Z01_24985 [Inquilinus sp. YAF38]
MEALVFDRFGGPEVLEYRTLPDPAVPPRQLPAGWRGTAHRRL